MHNYFPYRLMGLKRGRSFIRRIVYTTHKKKCYQDANFLSLNILLHDNRYLRLLCRSEALFGDFVTLVPTCYSKALGWGLITKCETDILLLLGMMQWFRSPGWGSWSDLTFSITHCFLLAFQFIVSCASSFV